MITIKLPIEPVAAGRPRFGKGFTYTPSKYRNFKNTASLLLRDRYKESPMSGPLEVCVIFSILKPKTVKRDFPSVKPDVDNFLKAVFDSCNGILWGDDAQVVDLHAFKVYGPACITISVKNKEIQ